MTRGWLTGRFRAPRVGIYNNIRSAPLSSLIADNNNIRSAPLSSLIADNTPAVPEIACGIRGARASFIGTRVEGTGIESQISVSGTGAVLSLTNENRSYVSPQRRAI